MRHLLPVGITLYVFNSYSKLIWFIIHVFTVDSTDKIIISNSTFPRSYYPFIILMFVHLYECKQLKDSFNRDKTSNMNYYNYTSYVLCLYKRDSVEWQSYMTNKCFDCFQLVFVFNVCSLLRNTAQNKM